MAQKFIFDLDNTLYRDPENKGKYYAIAAAQAAIDCGFDLPFKEAHEAALLSYSENGSELTGFLADSDIDEAVLIERYHERALDQFYPLIKSDDELRDSFNSVAPEDKVILTHSTSSWAIPILGKLGMNSSLPEANILTQSTPAIGYRKKNQSEEIFEHALSILEGDPSETVIFDDLTANLVIPKKLGMTTVLINWSDIVGSSYNANDEKFIDHSVSRFPDFFAL